MNVFSSGSQKTNCRSSFGCVRAEGLWGGNVKRNVRPLSMGIFYRGSLNYRFRSGAMVKKTMTTHLRLAVVRNRLGNSISFSKRRNMFRPIQIRNTPSFTDGSLRPSQRAVGGTGALSTMTRGYVKVIKKREEGECCPRLNRNG